MPRRLDGKLADLIRKTRAKRGFTERILAARAGLSRRQLRVIQQGGNTTVLRVIGLAHALGLTEIDLGGDVIGRVEPSTLRTADVKRALRELNEVERRLRTAREPLSQSHTER